MIQSKPPQEQPEPPRRIVVVHKTEHAGLEHTYFFVHDPKFQARAQYCPTSFAADTNMPFNWADAQIVLDKMRAEFNKMNQNPPHPQPNNSKGFTRS